MAYEKCPRCELNYILDGGKLCTVCRKEVCGEDERDDLPEMCSECGENPAIRGGELCVSCLKELTRRAAADISEDVLITVDPALEIDSVSSMDEIELDLVDEDLDDEAFKGEEGFGDDEAEEEEAADLPLEPEDDLLDEDDYGDDDPRNR